jgi:acyl carrier protein
MSNNISKKIKNTMSAVLNVPIKKISVTSSPDNIKNWDSIKHLQLIIALEEEFDIAIEGENATEMLNYPLIENIIKEILKNKI